MHVILLLLCLQLALTYINSLSYKYYVNMYVLPGVIYESEHRNLKA